MFGSLKEKPRTSITNEYFAHAQLQFLKKEIKKEWLKSRSNYKVTNHCQQHQQICHVTNRKYRKLLNSMVEEAKRQFVIPEKVPAILFNKD